MKALFKHLMTISGEKSQRSNIQPFRKGVVCWLLAVGCRKVLPTTNACKATHHKIVATPKFQLLQNTLLTLLFTVPQIPLFGSFSGGKVLAQQTGSCPAGTTLATVNWSPTNNLDQFLQQSFSPGGVRTTFNFSETNPGRVIDREESRVDSRVYGGIQGPNLQWNIGLGKPPDTGSVAQGSSTLTITFARPITLASPLTFLDVDRNNPDVNNPRDLVFVNGQNGQVVPKTFQDRITVTAFNGDSPVDVNLRALGNFTQVEGNVARGVNDNAFPQTNEGNVEARVNGPITRIQVVYEPGTEFGPPLQDQTIGLSRINICVPGRVGAAGEPNMRLVKRITNVSRNGQPVGSVNFNSFVDDPNDEDDNILQQAGRTPNGQINLQQPLQSGNEIEYTIYFLSEGDRQLENVRFCDLIPPGTSYVSNSLSVNGIGDQGRVLSPLEPLEQQFANICGNNNTNGAVIIGPTNIPNGQSGFIRFRVRID